MAGTVTQCAQPLLRRRMVETKEGTAETPEASLWQEGGNGCWRRPDCDDGVSAQTRGLGQEQGKSRSREGRQMDTSGNREVKGLGGQTIH